jgi:hypothetical protein
MCASVVGERAKATAMAVPSDARCVCSAANVSGKNGLCCVSAVQMPSKPARSMALASVAICAKSVLMR